MGLIMSIIAGAAMSVQGVMNTRLGEKVGVYGANAIVQGSAFVLSLLAVLFAGRSDLSKITQVNRFYLLGGALGFLITLTVMGAIKRLSPAVAVSGILISQLLVAALIDAFGIMGTQRIPFTWNKYIGLTAMIGGMLLFKKGI